MSNILIIGATSAIAQAVARRFSARGDHLYLLARDQERLAALAADLTVRGAKVVGVARFEADDTATHAILLQQAAEVMQGIDTVLLAYGTLPEQAACERNVEQTLQAWHTNATSTVALLTQLATLFETQRRGTIAVLTSVAGDRGRRSNYLYGAAKGAVSIFLEGQRQRLHKQGARVLTIKLGRIDTPMTTSFAKGPLWATPQLVAAGIDKAIGRGMSGVYYIPRWWRVVMLVIRLIPERLYMNLNL